MTHELFNKLTPTIISRMIDNAQPIDRKDYAEAASLIMRQAGNVYHPQTLFNLGYTAYINAKYRLDEPNRPTLNITQILTNTLTAKGEHYNTADEDRFASFIRAGNLISIQPAHALMLMVLKHLAYTVKQLDYTNSIDHPSAPSIDVAIDIMAYAILLSAMCIDKSGAFG